MNKKNIGWVVVGIIILGGVFYGGMAFGKSQASAATLTRQTAFGLNNGVRGTRNGGGFTNGQIISKDATSITVQLMMGGASGTQSGSKIIFLNSSTKITKSASGTLSDLAPGTNVSVMGTPNADGSISAQSVQIRPKIAGAAAGVVQ
jgi:hypothetical protein